MSEEQTNVQTDQNNDGSVNNNPQNNEGSLEQKLNQISELLKNLAGTPSDIKPEGLVHLGNQISEATKAITELKASQNSLQNQLQEALSSSQTKELEFEKEKFALKHGLDEEQKKLLAPIKSIDELTAFEEPLSKLIESKIPQKLTSSKKSDVEVPNHLKHLLK
jgi:seryl-tRNA synthetase